MKKQQKIIELRTVKKCNVSELETKITFAYSEAAGKRASLMLERVAELNGLEAGSTERFDAIAKYRAKLAGVNEQLAATVAQLKFEIQQVKAECERQCAAAEDDPEDETETDNDVTAKGFQPQETVYCDGSEHSARIVARRLINKMPHVPMGGSLSVCILRPDNGEFFVSATEIGKTRETFISTTFSKLDEKEKEGEFVEKARRMFCEENESGNNHVADPMSRVLDVVFGGNPVEQVDNLIADTVKDGKEAEDE